MRKYFTLMMMSCATAAWSQPVISSGFSGMAAVNGTTYTRTGYIPANTGSYQFVGSAKDGKLFASSFSRMYLYYIDPATFTITDSFAHTLYNISAMNEANTLFARTDNGVLRFNTATKTIVDSVNLSGVSSITERPNSKEVWVINDNQVNVVSYSSGLSASLVGVPASGSSDGGDVRFTTGGSIAYKLSWTRYKVYKIDANTKTLIDSSAAIPGGSSIEVSHDSSKIYVTCPTLFRVRIFRASDMVLIDSFSNGTREPFDLYRHPTRQEIWVVNHFKDSVTVFNESTNAQIAAFGLTSSPHSLAFSSGSTGVKNVAKQSDINAFPNPTSGVVTITGLNYESWINVYDISGRQVFATHPTDKNCNMDISALDAGMYHLSVWNKENGIETTISILKK